MEAVEQFLGTYGFFIVLFLTALILAKYLHGRKINLALAKTVSAALENALRPADTEYTWIGGVAGFKAVFTLDDGRQVKTTLTMCPRHSLLYLPFSLLLFGRDKLLMIFENRTLTGSEGHILRKGTRRTPGTWVPSTEAFAHTERIESGAGRFTTLAKDPETLRQLRDPAERLAHPALLHLATIPEDKMTYLHLDPRAGELEGFLKRVESVLKRRPG